MSEQVDQKSALKSGSQDPSSQFQTQKIAPANRRLFLTGIVSTLTSSLVTASNANAQQSYQPNGFQLPPAHAEQLKPEFRQVLQQFGAFSQHPDYGEIWTPSAQTVPQGWHPYPPCHWVNTKKFGWYFDDKTPWGQIVHHYGRWKHDPSSGWFWTPGAEFSPGWVLWRSNPQYIGWAPMPPDQDLQNAQAASIENTDSWLFMDVPKFGKTCDGVVLPPNMYPVILKDTQFITRIRYVDGIVVYELPIYIEGPFVEIFVTFDPWPLWFFSQFFVYINWIWNYVLIVNIKVNCDRYTPGNPTPYLRSRRGFSPARR